MSEASAQDWVPLLVPDMPTPQELMPWLERMHAARHYSNFGPLVRELEAAFAPRFGQSPEALTTVASATLGLELVLHALQLPPQSRVLLPTLTFVATATAVLRAGHIPVLADVDPDTWMLTPAIARAVCRQTQVDLVIPVATFGMPHDMRQWQQFEHETGIPVVIDAAGAFGSQWLNGAQGTLVFSLHATKSLPAGEGGVVVSTRPGLAAKVRQLSNFGINLQPATQAPVGGLTEIGTNAKMSEYHAAVALCQLQKWDQHARERQRLRACLMHAMDQISSQRLGWQAAGPGGGQEAPTLLCVRLPSAAARNALECACAQARVMTRRWYQPLLHQMPALQGRCQVLETPHAEALASTLLGLPFFLGMTHEQSERVCDAVGSLFAAHSRH